MAELNKFSNTVLVFGTHAFRLGSGGHSTLYYTNAVHLTRIQASPRPKLIFPAVALDGKNGKGTHVTLFVADRNTKTITFYDINYDGKKNYKHVENEGKYFCIFRQA